MNAQDFATGFTVDATPAEAFAAITNVRGWWSEEIEGTTDRLDGEFDYHYRDVHRCTMRMTELVPDERVVWHVVDNYFDFITDQTEWKGTQISFDVSAKGDQTEVRFAHRGLVPEYECYDVCSSEWSKYVNGSLKSLITTGTGQPNPREGVSY